MRLVVTGGQGQIATALAESALTAPNLTVIPLGRPTLDLATPGDVLALLRQIGPDIVISAAAFTAVDRAESEPDLAFRINEEGAGSIATAAAALGLPIIHLSTDYVFSGTKAAPYVETDKTEPLGTYGRSKLAGERLVALANPDHAILRTSWIYAANGQNFVRTMLRLASVNSEVSVVADQYGSPTYAPDIAQAIIEVAAHLLAEPRNAELRGIFHVCGSGATSWAGFAEEIFRQSAARGGPSAQVMPISSEAYPTPAKRPANSRMDCGKLLRMHRITMPEWEEALSRCMDRLLWEGTLVQ